MWEYITVPIIYNAIFLNIKLITLLSWPFRECAWSIHGIRNIQHISKHFIRGYFWDVSDMFIELNFIFIHFHKGNLLSNFVEVTSYAVILAIKHYKRVITWSTKNVVVSFENWIKWHHCKELADAVIQRQSHWKYVRFFEGKFQEKLDII